MIINCLKVLFLFLIVFIHISSFAQEYIVNTQKITTNDGLANLYTTSVFQDKRGFVWLSTRHGLNRYDGYNFKLYTKESHGLYSSTNLEYIKQGDNNNLWLFYAKELAKDISHIDILDTKNEVIYDFETYFDKKLPFKINDVLSIEINDIKNRQWIATKHGELFLCQNKGFIKIFQLKNKQIATVTVDINNNIYVGVNNEVIRINKDKNSRKKYQFEGKVENIWIDNNEKLWVQTNNLINKNNLIRLWSKSSNTSTQLFYSFERPPTLLLNGQQKSVYRTEDENWLIFQPNAIQLIDKNGILIYDLTEDIENQDQIWLHHIFEKNGVIWIAKHLGVFKISIQKNHFNLLYQQETLSDCRGITEDEDGNIYFNNKFIHKYNVVSKNIHVFPQAGSYLLYYYKNTLLSGNYDWFNYGFQYNLATKSTKSYQIEDELLQLFSILKLKKKNNFLIGTDSGLFYINLEKGITSNFTKYNEFEVLKNLSVNSIHQRNQQIWLATNKGIFLMTEAKGIIRHFSKASGDLPFENIRHLHIDKNNTFWLASVGGGLIQWQPSFIERKSSKNKQFTMQDGLSNNYLYAVYEDDYDNLWLPSDNGLMLFNKTTKQVRIFTTEDGLPHNEFNFTSHYKAKDGRFYFGGLGGLIAFNPTDFVTIKSKKIGLQFTSFHVLEDDKEKITDKTKLLRETNEITLKPTDKLMEFQFALLDFRDKKNHIYAYKIEGYTNNWTYRKENFIRLNNLPYGRYILRIKGRSGSEDWSKSELTLVINVIKPFYLQWWFIGLSIATLVGFIFLLNKSRINRLERDKLNLTKEVKKRTLQIEGDKLIIEQQAENLKALDIAKSRFFSNITHEFRTPLTLILGPIDFMLKNNPPKRFEKHLDIVNNNAKNLLTLVNQLLDISRLEENKIDVILTNGDIIQYTSNLIQQLEPLRDKKQQIVRFESKHKQWEINFDHAKWSNIVINLVSNAMKFTPEKGQITIELQEQIKANQSHILFKVSDTGIGIKAADLKQIFNRFYQVDNSSTRVQEGTGIGLSLVKELLTLQQGTITVESEEGKGTVFTVILPVETAPKPVTLIAPELNSENSVHFIKEHQKIVVDLPSIVIDQEKLNILIIEDNQDLRTYIKSCLDQTIFEVVEANNGQEGIEKAIQYVPDLIISDVMMPIKDGFEVVENLRENRVTSHIPVIMLTAKTAIENKLQGVRKGADVYLTKPFNIDELILRIYKLIESRKKLQAYYSTAIVEKKITIPVKEDTFIEDFRAYAIQHLDSDKLDSESLAIIFKMSRMQLHRKIKALTNYGTSTYVRIIRLERALQLLKLKELSISEVAYQTGFSSPSNFSTIFKKHYNKSPSEI